MLTWVPYPMIRIATFFAGGILLGIYQPDIISHDFASIAFLFLLALLVISIIVKRSNLFSGLVGLLSLFIGGYLHLINKTDSGKLDHLLTLKDSVQYYAATVNNSPEYKANSVKIELKVNGVKTKVAWRPVSGKVVLYISKRSKPFKVAYGDELLIRGVPEAVKSPANPGEFDFKRFLTFKNTWHQQFVASEQIKLVHHSTERGLLYYSNKARAWSTEKIKRYVKGTQEQGIALALVLGVNDGLDNELQNSYAASGSLHVLSVSGLHVGIIYLIILLLLKPIQSLSWSRWLIAVISIVCLWSYAFVTGLSPSVLRAVTMFSFVALARPFGHRTNIYNTLAASVFLLLLYNPYLILSVGFQLSYLAVLGIVYLQKPLYNLWSPESWFWDKVWETTCISIAAQLATFSLGLLYFHQFPVYFLFANLFVIPVSFVVLILGILLLVVSPIAFIASVMGWMLELSIKFLNLGVFVFEDLPFSLINGVHITTLQCWLLMGFVLSWILFFEFKKFRFVIASMIFVTLFSFFAWQHYFNTVERDQWVVYSVPGHAVMEWIDQGKSTIFSDSNLLNDKERVRFHILPNRLLHGVSRVSSNIYPESNKSFPGFSVFYWKGKSVLWIKEAKQKLPDSIKVDYVLVSNRAVRSVKLLAQNVTFGQMILDSSNSTWYSKRMTQEAANEKIPLYSVLEQGAFVVTM